MRVYRSLNEVPADFGPSAITIGNFDGVHAGHRRILRRLKALADARGWKPSVLTFDPHPTRVVAPERAPQLMTSPERRSGLMAEEGVEQVLILPFDRQVASLSPDEFVRQLLVERLRARAVVVGDNFRFGYRQAGDVAVLRQLGGELGFETEIVPAISCRGQMVSSSGIRRLIATGRVALAARFLERPYSLEGEVESGRGIGSRQTVPTLNLASSAALVPAPGVYLTRTRDLEGERSWNSLTNVGYRPTFGESDRLTIETFLLDAMAGPEGTPVGTLEGASEGVPALRRISVEFLERVRDERKFETPAALRAQILEDAAVAERYFRRRMAWTAPRPAAV
jgi:riboflavin kinase/FMN adenylyltransferase